MVKYIFICSQHVYPPVISTSELGDNIMKLVYAEYLFQYRFKYTHIILYYSGPDFISMSVTSKI